MELSDSTYKFGSTVVLAYPDTTRLAGYRAALGLWTQLSSTGTSQMCTSYFNKSAEQAIKAQDVSEVDCTDGSRDGGVRIVFGTSTALPAVTFCFINGLPAQEHIPALIDGILGILETHGSVQRLVVPAAANVSGIREADRLWVRSASALVPGVPLLPEGAQTSDVALSALDNLSSVSGIKDVVLLVHGDKRPSGSGYRQTVTFGSEYVDDTDSAVVSALSSGLALVVGVADTASVSPPVTRTRLNIDVAAKALPAFG
ncbi:hypothetical protein IWW39_003823 [Coemansia spiralis]|uniref:Uncharacterized protein n=1 Tax=Coemansia spiralis TaxID=417178 RepID=A0A9W8L276_9FUNG|nr:hypothetical protein IWW39_003823 [Coemansia spiralis]